MNYRLPEKPGYLGAVQFKTKCIAFVAWFLAQGAITEWIAFEFAKAGQWPSDPLAVFQGYGIFWPWQWVTWLWHFRAYLFRTVEPFSHALRWSLLHFVASCILYQVVHIVALHWLTRRYMKNHENLYGSARWANEKGLKDAGVLDDANYGGINLGLWAKDGSREASYLRDKSDRHVLVAAATRTGKTASVVTMTALEWAQSMIVLDIKGEIYENTAGFRQRNGHVCLRFAPKDPDHSVRFNPLSLVRLGTPDEVADAQNLAEIIGQPGREGESSAHWNDTSCSLIAGVILHEMYKARAKGRDATLSDVSWGLSPYDKTFRHYLLEMGTFAHDPAFKHAWKTPDGKLSSTHPFCREKALEAANRTGDEASGVLSTAKKRFAIFADPNIRRVTSGNDFELGDLRDGLKPVSLYLCIPPSDRKRLAPLLRIMVGTFMTRLLEKQQKHKYELLFLIDEFPTLRYLEPLESALSYCGSYGIRCMLIVQSFNQIIKHYGPDNEIIENCHIQIVFAVSRFTTAKMISETLGSITIQHAAYNFSMNAKLGGEGTSGHVQNTKRDLMTPAEIMELDLPRKNGRLVTKPGQFILILFGFKPAKGIQAFWFLDPIVKKRVGLPISDQSKALSDWRMFVA